MKTIQAFKFRLCPTPEQERLLSRHAGYCRFVRNEAFALQKGRDAAPVLRGSGQPPDAVAGKRRISLPIHGSGFGRAGRPSEHSGTPPSSARPGEGPSPCPREERPAEVRTELLHPFSEMVDLPDPPGLQDVPNRKTQEAFVCAACGQALNADTNAAKNILRAGQSLKRLFGGLTVQVRRSISVERQERWQKGIPSLSALAASEARGRRKVNCSGQVTGKNGRGESGERRTKARGASSGLDPDPPPLHDSGAGSRKQSGMQR